MFIPPDPLFYTHTHMVDTLKLMHKDVNANKKQLKKEMKLNSHAHNETGSL